MALSYEEALKILEERLKEFEPKAKLDEVGVVYYVGRYRQGVRTRQRNGYGNRRVR